MAPSGPPGQPLPADRVDASAAGADDGPEDLLTIGQLGRRYGLARSTLLYYDRIGVLSPSGRSAAGYRRYSRADAARLERIRSYRRAGLPLDVIKELLDSADADLAAALAARLEELNGELRRLREQQRFIVTYLRHGGHRATQPFLTSRRFVELLELAGVDTAGRTRWHAAFEQQDGAGHQAFLEFLCLPDDAIHRIRSLSGAGSAAAEASDRPQEGRPEARPRAPGRLRRT